MQEKRGIAHGIDFILFVAQVIISFLLFLSYQKWLHRVILKNKEPIKISLNPTKFIKLAALCRFYTSVCHFQSSNRRVV